MSIFKSYTYTWWEIAIFKVALLSLGIILGVYWHTIFQQYLMLLAIAGALGSLYVGYVSFKK